MAETHTHWIDGRSVPDALTFDVRAAGGGEDALIGRWPRASLAAVESAVVAAARSAPAWAALAPETRRERLAVAARALARTEGEIGHGWEQLGRRVGLTSEEVARLRTRSVEALEEALGGSVRPTHGAVGLTVCVPHWSQLVAGAARAVFAELAHGRTVILLSDGRAPMVGDLVARALEAAELDPGAAAVLHDEGGDALRALRATPTLARLCVAAPPSELRERFGVLRRATDTRHDTGPDAASFGAGLDVAHEPALELTPLVASSRVVSADEPLDDAVESVVQAAFGRESSLSGQAPDQLGRVWVPERRLSSFTEALLARLDDPAQLAGLVPPLLPIDRGAARERVQARALGLDEGATLIWTGVSEVASETGGLGEVSGAAQEGSGEAAPTADPRGGTALAGAAQPEGDRSRAARADGSLWASVFTNVDPEGGLARLSEPLPLLRLVRVESEAAARSLARRLEAAQKAVPG